MGNFLELRSNELIKDFLARCQPLCPDMDPCIMERIIHDTIKHVLDPKAVIAIDKGLEQRWYDSLSNGGPDYGVYTSEYYLSELMACFLVYSRKHLRDINSKKSLYSYSIVRDSQSAKSVLDLGCGLGYTTSELKTLYPDAKVYGVELEGTTQFKFAQKLASQNHFQLITDIYSVGKVDLIFASEYFEHIQRPIEHLKDILDQLDPMYLILANSFNTTAIGHFNQYLNGDEVILGQDISRRFNALLRERGYVKVKTKLWNSRPTYWVKK